MKSEPPLFHASNGSRLPKIWSLFENNVLQLKIRSVVCVIKMIGVLV